MHRLAPAITALTALLASSGLTVLGTTGALEKPAPAPLVKQDAGTAEMKPARRMVLIGWDGADRTHVKQYMQDGDLPALTRLASEGSIVAIDVLRTTDTKAGWAQILTGYEPETTRVYNNWRYRPIPRGYSVFERLEAHFGADFATVAVIGKHNHLGNEPPKLLPSSGKKTPKKTKDQNHEIDVVAKGGKLFESIPGKPYFHTCRGMDLFENGYMKDAKVGQRVLGLLEEHRDDDFFFFVHFAEIDHKGHHVGDGTPKQKTAYESADLWTGRIVDKLVELGIYDETLVYVTSDHGFDRGQKLHKDAPFVFLATNDPMVSRRGLRVDIAPTILDRFGLDLDGIEPPLDGHSLIEPYIPPAW